MEIELYSKIQNASDMEKVANMLGKCGIFGNDKQEFGMAVLLTCASERITPIQFARTYDLIGGKIKKKSMAAFAEFRKRGAKVRWLKTGDDGIEAVAEIEFEGVKSEHRFHLDQAKKQGLVRPNSNWDKTPGNMLRSRLLSNAIGMLCPEIYAGEVDDDFESPEPKPLLKADKPEARSQKPEPTIEVQATVVTATTEQPKAEEPPVVKTESAIMYSADDIAIDPATNRLTNKAMLALGSVIGESRWDKFVAWLKKARWITEEVSELNVDRAKRIMQKSAEIISNLDKMP